MRILNAAQMREADRLTIDEIGLPSLVLMENAGRQVVAAIETLHESLLGGRIAIPGERTTANLLLRLLGRFETVPMRFDQIDGIENGVPVTNSAKVMPQNAIGRAAITTNGSPQLW